MRASLTVLALLLFAASGITGCGLKDDLYLPPEPAAQQPDQDSQDDAEDSRT